MKKIYNTKISLSAFFLVAGIFMHGQQTGGNTELPNINPPSPESSFKTQFGNPDINEFKGQPRVTIPLHEIQDGKLKHSISLGYYKAGVKVNDTPNSVGINWILEAGGVINRTIYDIRDEAASQRLLLTQNDLNYLSSPSGAYTLGVYAHDIVGIDNETDIFNFSFAGYNGSFYLDADFKPTLITQNHNLKIETVGNFSETNTFVITTFDGTKYTFGGSNAIEKTLVRQNMMTGGVTSFYLTKIEDVAHNKIEFEYIEYNAKLIVLEKSEVESAKAFIQDNRECHGPEGITDCGPDFSATPPTNFVSSINVQQPKYISKIKTANEEVIFNYAANTNNFFPKIENAIISSNGINIRKIAFDYINGGDRFFLNTIKEYALKNSQETFISEHKLEYDNPLGIPARLSNSIDYLGYYNGVSNTQSLLPNLNLFYGINEADFFSQHQNQNYLHYADRRPNFEFAKKGTLTSITYPTKGKTVFEYEPVFARKAAYKEQNIMIGNITNSVGYDEFANPSCIPLSYNCSTTLSSSEMVGDTKMYITLNLHTETNVGGTRAKAIFDIIDNSNNQVAYTKMMMIPRIDPDDTLYNVAFSTDFIAQPGKTYQLKLRIADNICNQCFGYATVKYQDGWQKVGDGNIRLKKQYDISGNGITNIKRIYYDEYSEIHNIEKLNFPYKPNFFSNTYSVKADTQGSSINFYAATKYETLLNSNPQSRPLYMFNPVYPKITISYGGDDFQKGGEEKIFETDYEDTLDQLANYENTSSDFHYPYFDGTTVPDPSATPGLVSSISNSLYRFLSVGNLSGNLISQRIISNQNNNLYVKTSIRNTYAHPLEKILYNLTGAKVYDYFEIPPGVNISTSLGNMYVAKYPLPNYGSFLENTIKKEYMEDVPVNVNDDSGYKKLVTTTTYNYDNIEKQLSKTTAVLPDGRTEETGYKYAHEKSNTKLINANMIGIPLETEAKKDSKTISKTETRYDNPLNLLPTSVLSYDLQTPTTSSTEVTYDKYDEKGNIQQYTSRNGISTTIIWGYNKTQPIVRIEGAKFSDISQSLIDSIVSASNNDAQTGTDASEQSLISALDLFRNNSALANYQISTYTYDPLIGLRSITPPSGIREIYQYDSANRLEKVVDINGKVLKEYKYNYKN